MSIGLSIFIHIGRGGAAAGFLLFSLVGTGCSEAGGRLSPVGVQVRKRKLIKD